MLFRSFSVAIDGDDRRTSATFTCGNCLFSNFTADSVGRYYELWGDDGITDFDGVFGVPEVVCGRGGFDGNQRLGLVIDNR